MFASVFSWALERQRGQWSWRAALIGLVVVLPIVAIVLLCYAGIPVGFRLEMLVLLAFSGLWIAGFGLLRSRNPRFLVVLCMLFVLFQHGERSAALILGKHYADLADMLWINVSQLPQPAAPMPILRQTRSGFNVYQTGDRPICLFETPLPNTRYFNPFLELRTGRMKEGFRNSTPLSLVDLAYYGYSPARTDAGILVLGNHGK